MFFVVPIDVIFQDLTKGENSLLLYQQFLTWVIYVTVSALGVEVFIKGDYSTRLVHADMIDLEIVSECTGLHETIFLSMLILCFRGVKPMVRMKWAAYAIIFIFIENLPNFNENNSNQQQRFITLIDIIYEKKIPLMIILNLQNF